ncbi:hypothetical protein Xcel_2931 [Xylanimonas cellulosilytica DSM 15894]|uniref:Helicase XPB/Ssl2 N-terminal domain-containing protein n=1 Tax=Xylanimonas cellulosilytica (strain DSM 15894 / JCM 12276 / CECT 5975 / KCTC 9989 / LMG 20990 / NBRC 107835 / XIL07) TaxID=446471 RepID=D1BZ41_XYLCX|nr:helicase-associated domain-containing protein [Xylanimonas cellulosilytica]ACZ31938.1 hypothetical protein Xcel_2931 [Xylanimonas cellulosilytica DSM 15894]
MATFPDAVRSLPDDALVALLRARPDLASPSPSTLRSLAARASSRTSLERALAQLDTPTLQVLQAVLALESVQPVVGPDDVAAAVGAVPDDAAVVVGLLDRARALALLWTPETGGLRSAPGLGEVLAPARERLVLAPPVAEGARAVPAAVAEAEAASAAVEVVRLVDTLIRAWEDAPPPVLRSGGLGVRDLRRTAQVLDVDDATAAGVVELAAAAGLVADDADDPASYLPTTHADDWDEAGTTHRWAMLAAAWAGSRRQPWLVGTRDDKGGVRSPLSPDLGRGWVPRLRTQVLTALASLGPVVVRPADVAADLAWRTPRAVPPDAAIAGLLREAALLGATGAGALAPTGRVLLTLLTDPTATPAAEEALAAVLGKILPPAVDELLLQGDLTGVVPGRPSPELSSLVERAADVESRGAATTVRFTPASVTRALDAGATADELLEQLTRLSRTPVPQALDYLVRDTARRHASLRVGAAGSYVRAADPAVLTGLVEDPRLVGLGLIRLAPTVVAAAVPAAALQTALRGRGLVAALEGPDGRPLGRLRRAARIERGGARTLRSPYATSGAPTSDAERRTLVAHLRIADGEGRRSPFASTAGGEAGFSVAALARTPHPAPTPVVEPAPVVEPVETTPRPHPTPSAVERSPAPVVEPVETTSRRSRVVSTGSTTGATPGTRAPGDALALLRDAVREGGHVWLEVVDGHGRPTRRRVRPLRVESGRLRALDPQRGAELTVALHRIAAVDPDDD